MIMELACGKILTRIALKRVCNKSVIKRVSDFKESFLQFSSVTREETSALSER
jgi:hypothetical protein